MSNRPSSSLKNFTDLKQIGKGGFGVVYSAKRENGDKVAVKKIDRGVPRDRVRNEIASLRSLKHKHIVEFYEDFVENGDTYVVMELCELGSLRTYVQDENNGPLEESKAAHVLRQLITAVSYMHRLGIIHRDLSAGNVFIKSIRSDGCLTVKLGDFGLATSLKKGETACTIVGTPGYIAPQVFNQDYDQSADVFSLGGVLYTMLTARDPPRNGHINLNGLSSNAADLVEKMMHNDARRRIALTEITMSKLMRVLGGDDIGGRSLSKDFSTDRRSLERGRSVERGIRSKDGAYSSDRLSRERRFPSRSSSQPVTEGRQKSLVNRPIHDRLPTTSKTREESEFWPLLQLQRCSGQRIKTPGGRYIVETDNRARFEVAKNGGVIHRILLVECDTFRKLQKLYVHRIAERKEKCREENEDLIELTYSPIVYTKLLQLPKDVYDDYMRLAKMVVNTLRSRVVKITYRRIPQFPDAEALLMENGDLRIKLTKSLIVRKVENGDVSNYINGSKKKKEGVQGATLQRVNEVYEYLRRFEQSLTAGMANLVCFPIVFSAGASTSQISNNSPLSMAPSTASTQPRFAFSNISNIPAQIPRSAPIQIGRTASSLAKNGTNGIVNTMQRNYAHSASANNENRQEKYRLKFFNNMAIGIEAADKRFLRESSSDTQQLVFIDPSNHPAEIRFRRNEKPPKRASELLEAWQRYLQRNRS